MQKELNLLKRAPLAFAIIFLLLFLVIAGVLSVKVIKANLILYLPYITIKRDGSVEPETDFIVKTGSTYTLTANLLYNYAVRIQCSNIIFDGAGHTINGTVPSSEHFAGWLSDDNGLHIEGVTNVTVRNIEITGFNDFDVSLTNSTACNFFKMKADDGVTFENSSSNLITECNLDAFTEAVQPGVYLISSNSNKFYKNDIEDISLTNSNDNQFLENNFVIYAFLRIRGKNVWDNRSVGNYWNDYLTKYPNASEIGNTGIGDTPYVIDADNIDHYPLMAPVDNTAPAIVVLSPAPGTYNASSIQLSFTVDEPASLIAYSLDGKENITITENITLTGLTNGVHNLTIYAKDKAGNIEASETIYFDVDTPEPFPTLLVASASGVSITAVAACLLYYRKKRNH
jgi:nitrous oxidase accessory protein NosD